MERRKSKFAKRFVSIYIGVGLIITSFILGIFVGASHSTTFFAGKTTGGEVTNKDDLPPYLLQDVNFDLFWDVWSRAKERYLEQPVMDTQLFYGALSGIVASLGDPYSVFLDPATTKKFTEELSGSFEGIGAEIAVKKGQLVIVAPLPETPAARAGLHSGDQILKIDGLDTLGMPLDLAVSKIRGAKDTQVKLEVLSTGAKDSKELSITRGQITVASVTTKDVAPDVAYIRLSYFNETTPAAFEEAVQAALAKGAKKVILDLRNNPGGFLEVGVRVASEWVEAGKPVVLQQFKGGESQAFNSEGQARFRGLPTVVLVNEGSASASEIVAGALKDYGAAKLLGEKTFGKGSVQTFEELRGGSSIKLTVAHWLTPKGSQINGQGIAPDIEVKMAQDDYENDRDPQLQKAIEELK